MAEYRKAARLREVFKIDGDLVVRVLNKEKQSRIDVCDNWIIRETAIDCSEVCSEVEFKTAFNEALERINKMKI